MGETATSPTLPTPREPLSLADGPDQGLFSVVHGLLQPVSAQDVAHRALAASASLARAVNRGLASRDLSVSSLIPAGTGYVTRGHFPCLRLQGAPDVGAVRHCVLPVDKYEAFDKYEACDASLNQTSDLVPLAEYAAAIFQWSDLGAPRRRRFHRLLVDLGLYTGVFKTRLVWSVDSR